MFVTKGTAVNFPDHVKEHILKWKDKPGSIIMILHKVQQEYGYISRESALALSELVDVPLAQIYGVITFYHFFKLHKPGRHIIQVCMGTACYLRDGEDLIREFERLLGLHVNSTTEDGEFSLEAVRCIGCCGLAPVITINEKVYGNLTKDRLPGIIAEVREKAAGTD